MGEIFRFNKTLMDLEPHGGVPRYVTAEREARSDRLVRRGLAFIIEHGFYTTDQGRQHYLMNLRQIVDSVNETAYHGVVYALLNADNHYKEWHRQHGSRVARPGDLQRQARRLWGCVQKQERGLYLLDAELKDVMRYEGVTPDCWIVPSKMSIYVTMVDGPTAIKYSDGGPATQGALEAGPARFQTFRGCNVYESRPFDIDFIGEPYDLLVRRRQIGEHFVLGGQPNGRDNEGNIEDLDKAKGKFDSFIFSMDTDNFERVSFEEAAEAACNTLAEMPPGDKAIVEKALKAGAPSCATEISALMTALTPGSDAKAALTANIFKSGLQNGGRPPFRVLLMRPFETYDMASAILMKKGLETGMTAHGHHDFMLSDDVIHKVHIGHYTFYHKSIVKQPKNITIAEDIFARNYIRGEGVSLFTEATWKEDIGKDYFSKDIIAIRTNVDAVQNPCDLTGQYENQVLDASPTDLSGSKVDQLYGKDSAKVAADANFDKLKYYGEDPNKFLSPLRSVNTLTWQGMQVDQSKDGKFDQITLATGHWGTNVYAGCKSVRTGANAFLKDMGYEKIRSEQVFK